MGTFQATNALPRVETMPASGWARIFVRLKVRWQSPRARERGRGDRRLMSDHPRLTKIADLFASLWNDKSLQVPNATTERPLLAHYTSIEVLQKIIDTNQLWLSHPLLMNDSMELKFGLHLALRLILESKEIDAALQTKERRISFNNNMQFFYSSFDQFDAFDTYIFCLAKHDKNDTDGSLSMWRGYGGNGKGVGRVDELTQVSI
jgi:hypothetical protein